MDALLHDKAGEMVEGLQKSLGGEEGSSAVSHRMPHGLCSGNKEG